MHLRPSINLPQKFTPSDYDNVRRRIIFPIENNQKSFIDLPFVIQGKIISFVICKNFHMILKSKNVSQHFEEILDSLHYLFPKIYVNDKVMKIMEGKEAFHERIRHTWSLRQLRRVSGSGSGLMIELRNVLRQVSSRWIYGYIEVLACVLSGWYYITDFRSKRF